MHLYQHYNKAYDTPFLAYHIEDDYQFLKLCMNYDYYMTIDPVVLDNTEQLSMRLGDIRLLCYHDKRDVVLEKYLRRRERQIGKKRLCIWGDCNLYQTHTAEELNLIRTLFRTIPNSIYLEQGVELPNVGFDSAVTIGAKVDFIFVPNKTAKFLSEIERHT